MSDADAAGATTTVEAVVEHVAPAVEAQLEPAAKKAKVYVVLDRGRLFSMLCVLFDQ